MGATDFSFPSESVIGDLVEGIDHIGIAVADLDHAGSQWAKLLGSPAVDRENVEVASASALFLRPGGSAVELVAPYGENKGLEKFLETRGNGLHHLAIRVSDIDEAIRRLDNAGVRLIDKTKRKGAGGHWVAFLHPKVMGGTLVELVQHIH